VAAQSEIAPPSAPGVSDGSPVSSPSAPAKATASAARPKPTASASAIKPKPAKSSAPGAQSGPPAATVVAPDTTVTTSKPPVATAPAAAPLDLAALKQRLRDTNAIGVFTKLALKNQVDDLLGKFRGFYGGQLKISVAQLRQAYDLLVLKVLALLQDSDPALAKEIVASREAIWGLLSDPVKFATL
jgi:hypothetical protein